MNAQCQCSQGLYEGNYCQTRKSLGLNSKTLPQLPMLIAYSCSCVYKEPFCNKLFVSSVYGYYNNIMFSVYVYVQVQGLIVIKELIS